VHYEGSGPLLGEMGAEHNPGMGNVEVVNNLREACNLPLVKSWEREIDFRDDEANMQRFADEIKRIAIELGVDEKVVGGVQEPEDVVWLIRSIVR